MIPGILVGFGLYGRSYLIVWSPGTVIGTTNFELPNGKRETAGQVKKQFLASPARRIGSGGASNVSR